MDPNVPGLTRRGFVLGSLAAASLGGLPAISIAAASAQETLPANCSYVPWESRYLLGVTQFQKAFDELSAGGYRLVDLSGCDVKGRARHTGVWEKRPNGPPLAWFLLQTRPAFQAEWDRLVRQGYRPVRINGYGVAGTTYFASIWEQRADGDWKAFIDLTGKEYGSERDRLLRRGYRPVDLSGYAVGSAPRFAGIFEKSTRTVVAETQLTRAQLNSQHDQLAGSGHRLVRLSGYGLDLTPNFAAIWELSTGPTQVVSPLMSRAAFGAELDEMRYRGYRPVSLSGFDIRQSDRYLGVWDNHGIPAPDEEKIEDAVEAFMHGWDPPAEPPFRPAVPGLSIAFAKNGRLVYARGFGVAKIGENGAPDEPVTVHHQFRIASASKSVTATAIIKLIDQGIIRRHDKVFGDHGWLGRRYQTPTPEEWGSMIEVQHLLEHTAGGWGNTVTKLVWQPDDNYLDEAGVIGDDDQDQLINWVLKYRALRNEPGSVFEYSGFGYLLLAQIIREATRSSYETYVQQQVMGGSGTIAVASDTIDFGSEVRHYDEYPELVTTLGAPITPTATVLIVASSDNFPAVPFTAVITDPISGASEKVNVVTVTGTEWTVERDSSTAAHHAAGAKVWTPGRDPYSLDVARADAAGGLVATAIDLVRLMTLVDGEPSAPDLFSEAARRAMTTASTASAAEDAEGPAPYGLGWILYPSAKDQEVVLDVPYDSYFGAGSLDGTHSVMYRTSQDGDVYCWAGIVNTRINRPPSRDVQNLFGGELESTDLVEPMITLFNMVTTWPCYDLF